jgi:hypothetical protein
MKYDNFIVNLSDASVEVQIVEGAIHVTLQFPDKMLVMFDRKKNNLTFYRCDSEYFGIQGKNFIIVYFGQDSVKTTLYTVGVLS